MGRADKYRNIDDTKKKLLNVQIVTRHDEDADLSYLEDETRYKGVSAKEAAKYRKQDQERLASYGRDWNMIGIYAVANVAIRGVIQRIQSGGLWGIESDSGEDYFNSVGKEEYGQLKDLLKEIGIKKVPVYKDVKWVDR